MTDTREQAGASTDARYHKRISVAASPATVFALLTDPDRLRRWHSVVSTVDLSVGGAYRHLVVPGSVAVGEFTEIEPDRRLVYTWGWEGDTAGVPPGSSTVTVELQPDGDRTIIDLTHDGLPDEAAAASHGEGWDHYLERLAVAAETGRPGLDPWAAGPEDIDAIGAGEASLAIVLDLLGGLSDEDLDRPTPCTDFTVAELVDHVVSSLTTLTEPAATDQPGSRGDEGADAAARIADAGGRALRAWRDRGTDGEVELHGHQVPATMPVAVVLAELFVHGWDLSRALGQPFSPAPQVAGVASSTVRDLIPDERGDSFAPPQSEQGLGPVEALMAFTGRTP